MHSFSWLFRRKQLEADIQSEIANHVAARAADLESQGMAPAEALHRARLEFGSSEKFTEQSREAAGTHALEVLGQDLRFGARLLRKSPGFTLTAVLLLALGIGANATIYGMVDWLMLRPLPFAQAGQLTWLVVGNNTGGTKNGFSYPNFSDIRAQSGKVFSGVIGVDPFAMDGVTINGVTGTIWSNYVAGDFFGVLGVHPALGRFFTPPNGDDAGAPPELVLSYAYWQAHFAGRRDVTGQTVKINGRPFTIVGVAPRAFNGVIDVLKSEAYLPIRFSSGELGTSGDPIHDRANGAGMLVVGRRRPGLSLAQVQPELQVIGQRLAAQYPKDDPWHSLRAVQLTSEPPGAATGGADPLLLVAGLFLALAGMVLLLACVNIANLLLARARLRAREMAVRAALGAARSRLLRQMLTESLLLALLGASGGLLVAWLACHALDSLPLGAAVPISLGFAVNWRVFLYAMGIAVLTGIAVGIMPAWQASRLSPDTVLRGGGRGLTAARTRLRAILVAAEIAGSLALLIVAGLFTRSLAMVQHTDLGFTPGPVMNLSFDPHSAGYNQARGLAFASTLLQRVHSLPGVASASIAAAVPMGYYNYGSTLHIPGYQPPPHLAADANYNAVTPEYFATMGLRLLRGRAFSDSDSAPAPRVAVINEKMAEQFWPGRDPMGREFYRDDDAGRSIQIVGIVRNSITDSLDGPPHAYFYIPYVQGYHSPATLQIKVTGANGAAVLAEARSEIQRLEPNMDVFDVQPMAAAISGINGVFIYRLGAVLAGIMGLVGVLMAVIGVYGVVAYSASQRTQEIGVRIVLGAPRSSILAMVLRQGTVVVLVGIVLGVGLAALISGAMRNLLIGIRPLDPPTYLAAIVLLALTSLAASLIPARRAMRADPITALRCE